MKASLFYGEKDIRVEDQPTPEPGPGEVLIGIKAAGVCGSDLHNYRGNRPSTNDVPWEQGHELAGVVEALGPGVDNFAVGDRVGIEAEHLVGCGHCRECKRGDYHICPERGIVHGAKHGSHGFSSHDVTLATNCFPLPDHVSFDEAAILDCYACGVHAVNRTPVPVDGSRFRSRRRVHRERRRRPGTGCTGIAQMAKAQKSYLRRSVGNPSSSHSALRWHDEAAR
jgi:threonine dehydrogenase-like Zn-dependent dehydrogenase